MKNKTIFITVFSFIFFLNGFSQNVKIEIVDYLKNIESVEYSTYQYANASYSHSRPQLIFITDKDNFIKTYQKISVFFSRKQEYTDVFMLGIDKFRKENITEIDKKIINEFLNNIIKFRACFNLPINNVEQMQKTLIYIEKQEDFCNYLSCRNEALKKQQN